MTNANYELQQARITRKGICADDIKHKGLLSTEQIQDIPLSSVYEWVKIGKWAKRDFETWLKAIRVIE